MHYARSSDTAGAPSHGDRCSTARRIGEFTRATDAAGAISFALGAVLITTVAFLCLDVYVRVATAAHTTRTADAIANAIMRMELYEDTLKEAVQPLVDAYADRGLLPSDTTLILTAITFPESETEPILRPFGFRPDNPNPDDDSQSIAASDTCEGLSFATLATTAHNTYAHQFYTGLTQGANQGSQGETAIAVELCIRIDSPLLGRASTRYRTVYRMMIVPSLTGGILLNP